MRQIHRTVQTQVARHHDAVADTRRRMARGAGATQFELQVRAGIQNQITRHVQRTNRIPRRNVATALHRGSAHRARTPQRAAVMHHHCRVDNGTIDRKCAAGNRCVAAIGAHAGKRQRAGAGLAQAARAGQRQRGAGVVAVGVEDQAARVQRHVAGAEVGEELAAAGRRPQGAAVEVDRGVAGAFLKPAGFQHTTCIEVERAVAGGIGAKADFGCRHLGTAGDGERAAAAETESQIGAAMQFGAATRHGDGSGAAARATDYGKTAAAVNLAAIRDGERATAQNADGQAGCAGAAGIIVPFGTAAGHGNKAAAARVEADVTPGATDLAAVFNDQRAVAGWGIANIGLAVAADAATIHRQSATVDESGTGVGVIAGQRQPARAGLDQTAAGAGNSAGKNRAGRAIDRQILGIERDVAARRATTGKRLENRAAAGDGRNIEHCVRHVRKLNARTGGDAAAAGQGQRAAVDGGCAGVGIHASKRERARAGFGQTTGAAEPQPAAGVVAVGVENQATGVQCHVPRREVGEELAAAGRRPQGAAVEVQAHRGHAIDFFNPTGFQYPARIEVERAATGKKGAKHTVAEGDLGCRHLAAVRDGQRAVAEAADDQLVAAVQFGATSRHGDAADTAILAGNDGKAAAAIDLAAVLDVERALARVADSQGVGTGAAQIVAPRGAAAFHGNNASAACAVGNDGPFVADLATVFNDQRTVAGWGIADISDIVAIDAPPIHRQGATADVREATVGVVAGERERAAAFLGQTTVAGDDSGIVAASVHRQIPIAKHDVATGCAAAGKALDESLATPHTENIEHCVRHVRKLNARTGGDAAAARQCQRAALDGGCAGVGGDAGKRQRAGALLGQPAGAAQCKRGAGVVAVGVEDEAAGVQRHVAGAEAGEELAAAGGGAQGAAVEVHRGAAAAATFLEPSGFQHTARIEVERAATSAEVDSGRGHLGAIVLYGERAGAAVVAEGQNGVALQFGAAAHHGHGAVADTTRAADHDGAAAGIDLATRRDVERAVATIADEQARVTGAAGVQVPGRAVARHGDAAGAA